MSEEKNISDRLYESGYGHHRTPNAHNTGKHYVYSLETGEIIGEWTAFQSLDFLEGKATEER